MPDTNRYNLFKNAKEYEVVNLTPHDVHIYHNDKLICTFPPSYIVARCRKSTVIVGYVKMGLGKVVKITRTTFSEVDGLPEPKEGVLLIVSKLVAEKYVGIRNDLVITNGHIRELTGEVKGCLSLGLI